VTELVLWSYVIGWAVVSICLMLTARTRPQSIAVAAGAVWPLLIVGAAQLAAVALVAEHARGRNRSPGALEYSDDELHALIDQWRVDFEQRR
jgi:hypothetical protein